MNGGDVVYCAFEGADGFKRRAEAFRKRFLSEHSETVPFYLSPSPLDLVKDHTELIASIRAQTANPVLVVLDTLNRSLAGSESDDRNMTAYIKAADAIRDAFHCAVLVVHHCGVDASRPRGHTALTGAVDAQLAVKRDAAGNVVVTVDCMKDGPEGDQIVSALEIVELGVNEDGDPITSCVVVPVEGGPVGGISGGRAKLPKAAQIALRVLTRALSEVGEAAPALGHIPPDARVTTVEKWREHAYRLGISSSNESRALQQAFRRSYEALVYAQKIGTWNSYVWITQSEANR